MANLECIVCGELQARNAKAQAGMCGLGWMTTTMDRRLRGATVEASMSDTAANGAPPFRIGEDIVTETVCASVDHQPAHVETLILTAADDSWA
ncbi:MAG: hypothetical protein ABJF67_18325 [Aurantimonas coralicida]